MCLDRIRLWGKKTDFKNEIKNLFKTAWVGVFSAYLALLILIPQTDIISFFNFVIMKGPLLATFFFIAFYFIFDFIIEYPFLKKKPKRKPLKNKKDRVTFVLYMLGLFGGVMGGISGGFFVEYVKTLYVTSPLSSVWLSLGTIYLVLLVITVSAIYWYVIKK
ncbi:MAG: hypothetical protein WA139_00430 [Candidatus Aenigmatarchaeota archaeon]